MDPNDQEEDGANIDLDSQRKGKCAVIKTSTRQVFLHYTNETLSRICNWKCQHGANTLQESGWCLNDGHWLWSSVVSIVWMVLMCVLSKVNGSSTISTLLLLFYFHYYYYYFITTLSLHWMCEFHSQYLLFCLYWIPIQTYFLPVIGLVDAEKLKPGDLVVCILFPKFLLPQTNREQATFAKEELNLDF